MPAPEATALGLDGCAGGWVAVCLASTGCVRGAGVYPSARAALAAFQPSAVGIDMPIGLTVRGVRQADAAARGVLAGATSSVFNAPARAVVDGFVAGTVTTYARANELNRSLGGKGLTQQAWRLVPKIAEVDALVAGADASGPAVVEVHPEVSFRLLAGGARLPPKRSWTGLRRRLALLEGAGVDLEAQVEGGDRARPDDVVDAAVVAWTAAALLAGEALCSYPARPVEFDRSLPIAIRARVPGGVTAPRAGYRVDAPAKERRVLDDKTRALLEDARRDIADAAEQVSQAVSKLEEDESVSSEALLGEAMTRLKLVSQRLGEHLAGDQ